MVIKKLRRRFILVNMLLISAVLIVIFSVIIVTTAEESVELSYSFLSSRVKKDLPGRELNITQQDDGPAMPGDVFEVVTDPANNILGVFGDVPTEFYGGTTITDLIDTTDQIDDNRGLLSQENLRFVVSVFDDGNRVYAFMDVTHEQNYIYQQAINLIVIGVISLGVFFVISFFLSKMVIKPVEIAFKRQKQFISDASHELKTPLTVILANLSMASKKSEESDRYIAVVDEEANRMKALVEDLLYLSKLEEDNKTLVKTDVNLSDVAWERVLAFEPVAYEKGLKINSDIDRDINVKGDAAELKKLLSILFDNACKYSLENGVIKVSLKKSGGKAVFNINNSSSEMTTEQLSSIFSRFYRADKARGRQSGSFGLGLSLAKKITDLHGGEISADYTAERGTTFSIII